MTPEMREQLEEIRLSGETNMVNVSAVQYLAHKRKYYHLVIWLEEHKEEYLRLVIFGEEPSG